MSAWNPIILVKSKKSGKLLRKKLSNFDPAKFEKVPPWIEEQGPAKARRVYYEGSRTEACKALCKDCSGGSLKEAKNCVVTWCPLWPFRPGAKKGELPPGVPSKKQLQEMSEDSGKISANVEALKKARAKLQKKKGVAPKRESL